jgi:hypothetical protein
MVLIIAVNQLHRERYRPTDGFSITHRPVESTSISLAALFGDTINQNQKHTRGRFSRHASAEGGHTRGASYVPIVLTL